MNLSQKWLYDFEIHIFKIQNSYFHTEDNWVAHTQLLQKVNTFTDAQEGNTIH